MSARHASLLLAAAAALAAAPAARADWLVTRDGARVETAGPWQVKGKLVVFETAAGDLASLRLAEVDLEESRAATAEAAADAAAARHEAEKPAAPRRSVRVLTDKDFAKAQPAAPAPGADGAQAAAPRDAAAALQVTAWERVPDDYDRHVVITGSVRNTGAAAAADVGVVVRLFDEQGGLIASVAAELAKTVLPSGESAGFRADFPGVFAFAALKFETGAMRLETAPAPAASQPSR
ncbi:MAG TPA: FxLYD domain-containing protein [Thermoanaerobaculia bacterium]|nr:FxLYD domain-containing protein [Thermoanaerobaculia bacterium]